MVRTLVKRRPRPLSIAGVAFACATFSACQSSPAGATKHASDSVTMCSGYFVAGSPSYEQCLGEVDGAVERQSRSRSRVNCTPMGERMVCR